MKPIYFVLLCLVFQLSSIHLVATKKLPAKHERLGKETGIKKVVARGIGEEMNLPEMEKEGVVKKGYRKADAVERRRLG